MVDVDLSGAEMGAEDMGEMPAEVGEMDAVAACGVALARAAEDPAVVDALYTSGEVTLVLNEDGSVTVKSGEASLEVPASEIMGEPEAAMAEAQEDVAEASAEASAEGGE